MKCIILQTLKPVFIATLKPDLRFAIGIHIYLENVNFPKPVKRMLGF